MRLAIDSDMKAFVARKVESGEFDSPEQVVRAALIGLMQNETGDFRPGELDELAAVGIAELDRGEGIPSERVFAQIRRKSELFRRRRGHAAPHQARRAP